jgi:2'-5' RNA ligase
MRLQSALILPVPDAEGMVGELRRRYDPSAALGVPAHITLVFPFIDPRRWQDVAEELVALFRTRAALDVAFTRTGRFPQTLYLAPGNPADIEELVQRIVRRWPEHPPYGGLHRCVIPHLTVADRIDDQGLLDDLQRTVDRRLPLRTRLRDAHLLTSDDLGLWSLAASFSLSAAESDQNTSR